VLAGSAPVSHTAASPPSNDMVEKATDAGDDTASDSLMEAGEGDLGSELSFNGNRKGSVSKDRPSVTGKTDLASLLEGLGVEEEEANAGRAGMIRPPY